MKYFIKYFLGTVGLIFHLNCAAQVLEQDLNGNYQVAFPNGAKRPYDPLREDDLALMLDFQSKLAPDQLSPELLVYNQVTEEYKLARDNAISLAKRQDEIQLEMNFLKNELEQGKKTKDKLKLKNLKEQLKRNQFQNKEVTGQRSVYGDQLESLQNMLNMGPNERKKAYESYKKKFRRPDLQAIDLNENELKDALLQSEKVVLNSENTKSIPVKRLKLASEYDSYDPSANPLINPPSLPCELEFKGKDEFSGKQRVDLEPEELFFYTPPQMRKLMKEKQYVEAQAALSSTSGGTVFLTLTVKIASSQAQAIFKGLERGTLVNLKFIDGETVAIVNNRTDLGLMDSNGTSVSFRAQFNLGAGIQDMIRKKNLDKIRINWNSGYEDYEVYNVDLLKRQMLCL